MKDKLLSLVSEQIDSLKRIAFIASSLPETGPNPYYVTTTGRGEIYFAGHNKAQVASAFGVEDWFRIETQQGNHFRKTLSNGVKVQIDLCEPPSPKASNAVDPKAFEV